MISEQTSQTRVLLVEDEALVRWTGRRTLEEMGCLVIEAETCMEAEDEWKRGGFDVVVLDYRLPDGVSVDVADRMRARGSREPLIFMTAETERIGEREAASLGAVAVLRKPLNTKELKDALSRACGGASGNGVASASVPVIAGGFEVVECPGLVDQTMLEAVCRRSDKSAWIALLFGRSDSINDGAVALLQEISAEKRRYGGRICVVSVPEKLKTNFIGGGVDREIDVFSSVDELNRLGRRTTTPSERMSLMDVAVRRDHAG